jgi:molybdopterin-binding protein
MLPRMVSLRLGQAAELLGMSVSALRRQIDEGTVRSHRSRGGHRLIEGVEVARLAASLATKRAHEPVPPASARNRFRGIVTGVTKDAVAAKVEIQAGQHRIVSLTTREAVDELGLQPGVLVVASVKATNVVVERPEVHETSGKERT